MGRSNPRRPWGPSIRIRLSGGRLPSITVTGADYVLTADSGYRWIRMDTGAVDRTLTLPAAADLAEVAIYVKKPEGSGVGRILIPGAEPAAVPPGVIVDLEGESVTLCSDGTRWEVI